MYKAVAQYSLAMASISSVENLAHVCTILVGTPPPPPSSLYGIICSHEL